jgi:acyl-CoA hydrolase
MVALDDNGKPVEVPQLKLETEEDKALFNAGQERYDQRAKRMKYVKKSSGKQQS